MLSKLWSYTKWWAETLRGAAVVVASPNEPIPPTKIHPRMPPMPSTYGEWFRMYPMRYVFVHLPFYRFLMLVTPVTAFIVFVIVPYKYPRLQPMLAEGAQKMHEAEEKHAYGFNQKARDREYFEKHDPMRKFRPHAYDLVYAKGGH